MEAEEYQFVKRCKSLLQYYRSFKWREMHRDRRRVSNSSRLLDGRGLHCRPMQIPGKNVSKLITILTSTFWSNLLDEAPYWPFEKGEVSSFVVRTFVNLNRCFESCSSHGNSAYSCFTFLCFPLRNQYPVEEVLSAAVFRLAAELEQVRGTGSWKLAENWWME